MFHYSILIQFMKGDAPAMDQHMEVIGRAVDYYNAHSRMALNPKEIVSYRLKDSRTLEVVLNSKNELQEATASKALRLFSQYLAAETTPGNLSAFVTNKRLFKMQSSRRDETPAQTDSRTKTAEEMEFACLDNGEKLDRIYEMLCEMAQSPCTDSDDHSRFQGRKRVLSAGLHLLPAGAVGAMVPRDG